MPKPPLPKPWKSLTEPLVGGLLAVGYGKNSDHLLVVADDGLAVYNAQTGKRIAREYTLTDELSESYYDFETHMAPGIGPLDGQIIPLAGPYGGHLKSHSKDGWALSLGEPGANGLYKVLLAAPKLSGQPVQIGEVLEKPFAYGFSDTGRTIVVASSNTLLLFVKSLK